MSRRPSISARRSSTTASPLSSNANSICTTCDYAIIGDTTAAVLYASRLTQNGVDPSQITIITEGTNKTAIQGIQDLDFAVMNSQNILFYMINETVSFIPSTDGTGPFTNLMTFPYYYGAGPCGDFIATYIVAQNGPWYPSQYSNPGLVRFFNTVTNSYPLNSVEQQIITALNQPTSVTGGWNLPISDTVIVSRPSLINQHWEFIDTSSGVPLREIGNDVFSELNVDLIQGITDIEFTGGTGGSGFFDIVTTGVNGVQTLINNKVVWKTNPYSFLHLASVGTTGTNPVLILPSFYRAVVTIPNVTSQVNLNNLTPGPDLVTTFTPFSLYDLDNTRLNTAFIWFGQFYTTSEDLYQIDLGGTFADTGYSLLVVECICFGNKRSATYNSLTQQIQVAANSGATESKWQLKFAEIVSDVYYQYTGQVVDPSVLTSKVSVCCSGICSEAASVDLFATRESTMVTVVETVANLYGSNLIPSPGK